MCCFSVWGLAPTAGKASKMKSPGTRRIRSSGAPKSGEIGWTTTPALPSGASGSTEPGFRAIGAEDVHIHGYRSAGPTQGMAKDHRGGRLGRWGRPNPPRGKSSLKYRATDATAGLYQGSVHTGPGTGIRPPTLEWGKGKVWEGKCKVAQELEGPYARQAAAQLWVNHLRHPRQKLLGLLLWCSRTGLLLRRLGARGQGAHGWGTRSGGSSWDI